MSVLLFVWELPQILLGLIIRLLFGGRLMRRVGRVRSLMALFKRSIIRLVLLCSVECSSCYD